MLQLMQNLRQKLIKMILDLKLFIKKWSHEINVGLTGAMICSNTLEQ